MMLNNMGLNRFVLTLFAIQAIYGSHKERLG